MALEGLKVLEEEGLVDQCAAKGEYLFQRLREVQAEVRPLIRDVRGRGLWAGVDIDPAIGTGREVCERLMARGVLAKDTHGSTIRLAPPLVITKEEIDTRNPERVTDMLRRNESSLDEALRIAPNWAHTLGNTLAIGPWWDVFIKVGGA